MAYVEESWHLAIRNCSTMYTIAVLVLCLGGVFGASMRVTVSTDAPQLLTLPSNATSIREEISDSFVCDGRDYGYYADVDNGCQVFHVCLPVTFSDGKNTTFRWSFICPEDTIFNQEIFTCTRLEDSIACEESPNFYTLNNHFGVKEPVEEDNSFSEEEQSVPEQEVIENKEVEPPKVIPLIPEVFAHQEVVGDVQEGIEVKQGRMGHLSAVQKRQMRRKPRRNVM